MFSRSLMCSAIPALMYRWISFHLHQWAAHENYSLITPLHLNQAIATLMILPALAIWLYTRSSTTIINKSIRQHYSQQQQHQRNSTPSFNQFTFKCTCLLLFLLWLGQFTLNSINSTCPSLSQRTSTDPFSFLSRSPASSPSSSSFFPLVFSSFLSPVYFSSLQCWCVLSSSLRMWVLNVCSVNLIMLESILCYHVLCEHGFWDAKATATTTGAALVTGANISNKDSLTPLIVFLTLSLVDGVVILSVIIRLVNTLSTNPSANSMNTICVTSLSSWITVPFVIRAKLLGKSLRKFKRGMEVEVQTRNQTTFQADSSFPSLSSSLSPSSPDHSLKPKRSMNARIVNILVAPYLPNIAPSGANRSICCICLDAFSYNQPVASLSCSHVYHYPCLQKWMKLKSSCPECRRFIRNEVIYVDVDVPSSSSSSSLHQSKVQMFQHLKAE